MGWMKCIKMWMLIVVIILNHLTSYEIQAYKSLKRHVVKSAGVIWSLCHAKFAFIGYMREDMVVDETC